MENNNQIQGRWNTTPISMWGYFGYDILFMIPFVGIIVLIIFAVGGTNNINVRNYARSKFCMLIICLVLLLIAAALGLLGAFMTEYS